MMRNAVLVVLSLPVWWAGVLLALYAAAAWLVTGKNAHVFSWLIAIDQLGNTLAFGNPDETISSRAGRCAKKGGNRPCYWLCRLPHLVDKDPLREEYWHMSHKISRSTVKKHDSITLCEVVP